MPSIQEQTMRPLPLAAIVLALIAIFSTAARAEQPLSGHQQTIYNEVNAGLDAVDQALADARAKLDAGDLSGASGTYNTAVRNFNNHGRRISQLPAGHTLTNELLSKAELLGAKLKETGDQLKAGSTGNQQGPADKPAEGDSAKPAPASSKLDYRQVEKLKSVRFHLKEIEPRANRIFELTAGNLDAEAIVEALDLMKFVHQRMGYVSNNLAELPAENSEVAVEAKQFNSLVEKLAAAQAAIEKAAPEADRQIAALGEQMNNDLAMVDSWSKSLGNPQFLFDNRPQDAMTAVGQLPQMRAALGAMMTRWTTRSTEKPNDTIAADMVRQLKYVDGQLTEFEQYTKSQAETLPQAIQNELTETEKLIEVAVTERRPPYFGPDGGVAQRLKFASEKLAMLNAIDPAAGEPFTKAIEATREKSVAAQKSLSEEIIKSNLKPAERYAGPDLEDLRQRVIATWKEMHPTDEIIAVIFNTEGWSRTTRWDWSKGYQAFEKVDYDHIQPKLFYKLNDQQAVQVPVEIYKDYMKNERIVVKPWDKEAEPSVTFIYLLENLK